MSTEERLRIANRRLQDAADTQLAADEALLRRCLEALLWHRDHSLTFVGGGTALVADLRARLGEADAD